MPYGFVLLNSSSIDWSSSWSFCGRLCQYTTSTFLPIRSIESTISGDVGGLLTATGLDASAGFAASAGLAAGWAAAGAVVAAGWAAGAAGLAASAGFDSAGLTGAEVADGWVLWPHAVSSSPSVNNKAINRI